MYQLNLIKFNYWFLNLLPADTGTAVINPRVINKSYVNAMLKLASIFATVNN